MPPVIADVDGASMVGGLAIVLGIGIALIGTLLWLAVSRSKPWVLAVLGLMILNVLFGGQILGSVGALLNWVLIVAAFVIAFTRPDPHSRWQRHKDLVAGGERDGAFYVPPIFVSILAVVPIAFGVWALAQSPY